MRWHDFVGSSPDMLLRGPEVVDNTIKTLQSTVSQSSAKVQALEEFQLYVRDCDAAYIKQQFK